jgi:hypothetical protein
LLSGYIRNFSSRTRLLLWLVGLLTPPAALGLDDPVRAGTFSRQTLPDVAEVATPDLPDIAAVQINHDNDVVILYNPSLCRHAGPALCEFYRYHEYGHIALNHLHRNDISDREKEREADRWAAMHAPLSSVIAAYKFFSAGRGGTPMHGQSQLRAARMVARFENQEDQNALERF